MPWDFIEWAIVMVKISRQPEKREVATMEEKHSLFYNFP
jgi:hypothetical protein